MLYILLRTIMELTERIHFNCSIQIMEYHKLLSMKLLIMKLYRKCLINLLRLSLKTN